jgi:hypothetical protein
MFCRALVIAEQTSCIFISNKIAKHNIQTTPHQVQSIESNARSKILQISDNALGNGMAVAYN